jgi:hypothetical protein
MDTNVLDENPKKAAKRILKVFVLAGIHSARAMIAEIPVQATAILNRPMRSPSQPGMMRPNILEGVRRA